MEPQMRRVGERRVMKRHGYVVYAVIVVSQGFPNLIVLFADFQTMPTSKPFSKTLVVVNPNSLQSSKSKSRLSRLTR